MKLHLPKMLTAALLAAFTVLAANTTVQAETTAPVYSGQIITWNNATNANPGDLAHGKYRITTYESGSFIVSSQDITGWGTAGSGPGGQLISQDTMEDRNTLRFAADTYGQTQKNPVYTFNPLVLAGIIVDDGAEGYSISTTSTASTTARNIYLGNKNSTAAYSSINEDFTINKAHGAGKVYLRGTQTIDVASDKTYTINSNNGFEISGALTVQGGTLKLSGATTLASTITNNGTVNFNGTVSITDLTGFKGEASYSDDKNGYLLSAKYTLWEGEGTTIGLDTVQYGTSTLTVENKAISIDNPDYNTYHVNSGVVSASAAYEGGYTPTAFQMAADTVLTIDRDVEATVTGANKTSSLVMIDGSNTLTGTASTVTIGGTGTYALTSNTSVLGTNVLLATGEGWKGTVRLSGVSINNINLNNYGHEGSKVEFNGVTGYFLQSNTTVFAPKLVLEGEGLKLNDGFSTLASGNPKPPTKYTFAGGVSGEGNMTFSHKNGTAANVVTQHLYFTGDVAGWTGSLSVVAGFTVYAQYSGENKTVNSLISRTGGTLHVEVGTGDDASVVTYTKAITSNSLTVNAGATANINGGLTTNTITVGDDATLAINGKTTLTSAITSAGTVTLTDVALSDAFQAQEGGEKQYFVESTANYYLGTAYEYLDVVTGTGAANATGTGLTWGGQEALAMAAGQVKVSDHGTASYDTLYIGQDTTTVQIAQYENIESLANIVVKNGKLTVGEGDLQQPVTISVIEHGTISGDVTPEEVEIAEDATAEFTMPVTGNHYTFSAAEGATVAVTNNGETPAAYTGDNRDLTVVADTLEAPDAWEDVTISNKVQVANVVAADYTNLTLDNVDGTLDLQKLEIGSMAFVQVYASDEHLSENEATVVISDTLTAGLWSVLNADLTMKGGSTLDLDGSNGIAALTLGSMLTFDTTDNLVNLGEDIIAYLSNMEVGDSVDLFKHGVGTSLDYGGEYEGAYYDALFVRTDALVGDFTVYADGEHFGLTKYNKAPEPTTGTLSLLALAALAARRRKH